MFQIRFWIGERICVSNWGQIVLHTKSDDMQIIRMQIVRRLRRKLVRVYGSLVRILPLSVFSGLSNT